MKVKSSIAAPFKEIDPTTLPFSNWILSFSFKASVLESFAKFSFLSKLGVSVLFSIFFCSAKFCLIIAGSGWKKREYKIITAADSDIAAICF